MMSQTGAEMASPVLRRIGDIGFTAIRGGDVVGEHDVIFAADGERSRVASFWPPTAPSLHGGALKAALWGQVQKPGEYDMMDVLGLS